MGVILYFFENLLREAPTNVASSFYSLYSLGEGGGCFQHNYIHIEKP